MALGDILSDISAFSNPFGAPSKGKWNLVRGIYTNSLGVQTILFFESSKGEDPSQKTAIDQISDSGGRRLAVYEYPYIDGQKVEDLGRKGETYTLNIKFFGANYQIKVADFIRNVINDPGPGDLLHPALSSIGGRGSIHVHFRDYEFVHRYDEWNAITIKVVFVEDNTGEINTQITKLTPDSFLRSALQTITNVQSIINNALTSVTALLSLPGAILTSLKARLSSIVGNYTALVGKLTATFSSHAVGTALASQSVGITGGTTSLNAGTIITAMNGAQSLVSAGGTSTAQLPPLLQVGFDAVTQTLINEQIANFINANQITPQQAVFAANQIRQAITDAINEINELLGNDGYGIVLEYRTLAIAIQQATEGCIAVSQSQIITYTVPYPMSLRIIAQKNNLTPDRQNDIEALNPYLPSVNYIPKGMQVIVPAV